MTSIVVFDLDTIGLSARLTAKVLGVRPNYRALSGLDICGANVKADKAYMFVNNQEIARALQRQKIPVTLFAVDVRNQNLRHFDTVIFPSMSALRANETSAETKVIPFGFDSAMASSMQIAPVAAKSKLHFYHFAGNEPERRLTLFVIEAFQKVRPPSHISLALTVYATGSAFTVIKHRLQVTAFKPDAPNVSVSLCPIPIALLRTEWASLLSLADCVVQPTEHTQFNMPAFEALCLGTPVIIRENNGTNEWAFVQGAPRDGVIVHPSYSKPGVDFSLEEEAYSKVFVENLVLAIEDVYTEYTDLRERTQAQAVSLQKEWDWETILDKDLPK